MEETSSRFRGVLVVEKFLRIRQAPGRRRSGVGMRGVATIGPVASGFVAPLLSTFVEVNQSKLTSNLFVQVNLPLKVNQQKDADSIFPVEIHWASQLVWSETCHLSPAGMVSEPSKGVAVFRAMHAVGFLGV